MKELIENLQVATTEDELEATFGACAAYLPQATEDEARAIHAAIDEKTKQIMDQSQKLIQQAERLLAKKNS